MAARAGGAGGPSTRCRGPPHATKSSSQLETHTGRGIGEVEERCESISNDQPGWHESCQDREGDEETSARSPEG